MLSLVATSFVVPFTKVLAETIISQIQLWLCFDEIQLILPALVRPSLAMICSSLFAGAEARASVLMPVSAPLGRQNAIIYRVFYFGSACLGNWILSGGVHAVRSVQNLRMRRPSVRSVQNLRMRRPLASTGSRFDEQRDPNESGPVSERAGFLVCYGAYHVPSMVL
jgi:hypothetical protein